MIVCHWVWTLGVWGELACHKRLFNPPPQFSRLGTWCPTLLCATVLFVSVYVPGWRMGGGGWLLGGFVTPTGWVMLNSELGICDPLWENVHFRAKCIVETRVKIAETLSLVAKRDYDTGKNYSLSSTFSRWSDVRAPLLPLTASSQRREAQPRIRARCAWNDKCAERVYQQLRVTKETLQTNNMASPADTATRDRSGSVTRASALARRSGGPSRVPDGVLRL